MKWFYAISVAIVIIDQLLKAYMSQLLPLCRPGDCESIEILPVFQLTLLHNAGAAFSFLADAGGWQRAFLVAISTVVSVAIGIWLWRVKEERLLGVALALILGGAVGNLIDRALVGYVVDFIVLHWNEWYFPAFNVADASITVGAGALVLDALIRPHASEKTND
ncbi:MAG: signal peptidase II [Gammaproteobacteria bacterium]|nr:signal peptidase II [Gammaproteobacteria bacterium]